MNKPKIHTPCPFCGGLDIDIKFGGHREQGGMYVETAHAVCNQCKAHGPRQEIRNFNGRPSMDSRTRHYLMFRAYFFFGHGYLDVDDSNEWGLALHGDKIRNDEAPDFNEIDGDAK